MKIICLSILFIVGINLFSQRQGNIIEHNIPSNLNLDQLKKNKALIDQYVYKHQKDIIVLAKIVGKKNLVKIVDENYPEETYYIYNLLRDTTGKIIMIAQMPYSESGDWYIEYKHYINEKGNVFAFSNTETLFDNSVKGGLAMKQDINYYNENFKIVFQISNLTDKNQKPLKRKRNEFDFRNDKFTIYKNVDECLKAYNIKL